MTGHQRRRYVDAQYFLGVYCDPAAVDDDVAVPDVADVLGVETSGLNSFAWHIAGG